MALVMYLNRAPRYEGITIQDIKLIEAFFRWKHENDIKGKYSGGTFEQWCGHSEDELPSMHIIKYFYEYYKQREMYVEGLGAQKVHSVFEQMSRMVKANQILNWFGKNVMNNNTNQEYHEVTQTQLAALLEACNIIKNNIELDLNGKYTIDETLASSTLPVIVDRGYFFGGIEYDDLYVRQIIKLADDIENILKTTDFEEQVIYFNAIW